MAVSTRGDTLQRILADLCTMGDPKDGALTTLKKYVDEVTRDLSGESFSGFMDHMYESITGLIEDSNAAKNMGALRAMDEIIDVALRENALEVSKFYRLMRMVFEVKQDPEILLLGSKVLGHLARVGEGLAADDIEIQIKSSLNWLRGDRYAYRRFAAVLIIKELAENASTIFNVHVHKFVDVIWVGLRDPGLAIREKSVEGLRACLRVIEKRDTRWRIQWYYQMYEAAQVGLGKNASINSIHGSLLAIGELLRNTGEFMMSRHRDVAYVILKYLDHKDRLVRLSITSLLPRIAHFWRDCFVKYYLKICMEHILAALYDPIERAKGFIALGEMIGVLNGELIQYLPQITLHLRDAIAPRRGKPSMEALTCVGSFVKAIGPAMEPHVRGLLDSMFSAGLSLTLVDTLEQINLSLPSLLPCIQERLLDCITLVLSKRPCLQPWSVISRANTAPNQRDPILKSLVQLALTTLAHFNFKGHELIEFTRNSIIDYLEDEDDNIRRDAAICCCKLVTNSFLFSSSLQFTSSKPTRVGGVNQHHLVDEIMEKFLVAAVSDSNVSVRQSIFGSLYQNNCCDEFLAQAESLFYIFAAMNDEDFEVKKCAISIAGRLSEKNPAYVFPALRRHLVQLLNYLNHSTDSKCHEESAKLLGCLIQHSKWLIIPYIAPVYKVLLARLCEDAKTNASHAIFNTVLATVGELAKAGGFEMRKYLSEIMPLIVEALSGDASFNKREVALDTLGQLVQSTGYVISPYIEYPKLLDLLLKLLNGESAWSTRQKVLKVLGIMGSLDPHVHKLNQLTLLGSHEEVNRPTTEPCQQIVSMEELSVDILPSFVTYEDYYTTVAISSLMQTLRDPSLFIYHKKAVRSLIFIFESMGLGCVQYLPKVLPDIFHVVRTCEDGLKEFITWKLGTLVSIVQKHIRKYLPELLNLISDLWSFVYLPSRSLHSSPILHLVEQLCIALQDEFRTYLTSILPNLMQVLIDAERFDDFNYVPDILHTFEVFGGMLDEHMHLVFPALIRLLKVEAQIDMRRCTIKTIIKLIPQVHVSCYVSVLVHHLNLVLDGNNEELRRDAADALCLLVHVIGEGAVMFVPSIHKILLKHHFWHRDFEEIQRRVQNREPPTLERFSLQKFTPHFPVEVISVPIKDIDDDPYVEGEETHRQLRGHQVNDVKLRIACEASQRITKEDWAEWMRRFNIETLKESPSCALRTCAWLAQLQPSLGRKLFAFGFASCWVQMNETSQEQLVRNLKAALSSHNIPLEILATLLNMAEFMEHLAKPLPIDTRLLGALSEKCGAFAKALHYKEMEFEVVRSKKLETNPVTVVESLIHINNQLQQHEAAIGILNYSQQHLNVQLKESWYEKLQQWDAALKAYTVKASDPTQNLDATLGQMRCLGALDRWDELNNLCKEYWAAAEPGARLELASMGASAAWKMGEWDQMSEYVSQLDDGDESKPQIIGGTVGTNDESSNGDFFRAVISIRQKKYDDTYKYVERARKCLTTKLATLVLESYERAYSSMVKVQQLSELEEVIDYSTLQVGNVAANDRRNLILNMWNERLRGAKRNVEVWQELLAVQELVVHPTENIETYLKFSSLCRKSGHISQARSTLCKLLQYDPESAPPDTILQGHPRVVLSYLKYQWFVGDDPKRRDAFSRLRDLELQLTSRENNFFIASGSRATSSIVGTPLLARVYLKLGAWQHALTPSLDDGSIQEILISFKNATHCAKDWAKAWHTWALFNTAVISHYTLRGYSGIVGQFVVSAVTGYFYSIAYTSTAKRFDDNLQDILHLLTLWFKFGANPEVQVALWKGFSLVKIETWLVVLPQIIARIDSNNRSVRELVQTLLVRIGKEHPQALMYPLLVACKSIGMLRRAAAQEVVDKIRQHSGVLVDQAQLVSKELIRVSILWHEMWHEALEEARRLYYGEHNIEGMLAVLEPLHAMIEEGYETPMEFSFLDIYGRELWEARKCCLNYRTGRDGELTQAWDLYYHVFKRINEQLPSLTILDLQSASLELIKCQNLELAVPGTYHADAPLVTILSFAPQLAVITSKQRPRKLTIHGSDGKDYIFLLKGHEDLRQDERVMQLFGLVNTLLENSENTSGKDLSIERYSVTPLSPNNGLIGWVPKCDTLDHLICEFRDANKILLNQERTEILAFAPDYDRLPLISKVEAFELALEYSEGNDLAQVIWLKSKTSEIWLARRTNYTRSLAVMSMVGYLLGLGDRHLGNLMLHRLSGNIVHIDFGDCFEAAINRENFPEKVPFRLTRMLVKAMGVSGVEGTFRITCENVMQVLRTNKDSVMAMMEAFVHDPLINWRLFNFNQAPKIPNLVRSNVLPIVNGNEAASNRYFPYPLRGARERELQQLLQAINQLGDPDDVLNERAVAVIARMGNKLTGRDFAYGSPLIGPGSSIQHLDHGSLFTTEAREVDHGLSVKLQVQKLIEQATSHENLCQNYVGWCPFW